MIKYILLTISLLFTTSALAHSWYPNDCCSDKDCKPVKCTEIMPVIDGFEYNGYKFTRDKIRASQDGTCHICITTSNYPICVFFPGTG